MTYAGRLDPMAEGVLLVLSGDAIAEKQKYLDLPKTYTFQILWGFETDTLDILGKVSNIGCLTVPEELKIREVLEKSIGKFEQKYPVYSSKPVNGTPMFQLAREGKLEELQTQTHEVELISAEFISRHTISSELLLQYIVAKVNLVTGDFRQKEIIEKWQDTVSRTPLDIPVAEQSTLQDFAFTIDTIEVVVGSGFYVRQFVADLAEKLGTVAITFHIKRTKIGEIGCGTKMQD